MEAGIEGDTVEAIRLGLEPQFKDQRQASVYNLAKELYENRFISDTTYNKAIEILGQAQVIDLVAILGFYTMVALTLNGFHAPLPDGAVDPFE